MRTASVAAAARRESPLRMRMDETEPSSATWTSRTTLPARWLARAAGGYWGSVRRRRRISACAGDSQTLWDEAVFVVATFVGASFVVASFVVPTFVVSILVVDDASTTESLSCRVESGLAWRCFVWSGFAGAGFMRKMTLPFS